jgi:peroxiredoxin Q/BCP
MRRLCVPAAVLAVVVCVAGGALAAELEVGDVAPPFELPGSDGNTHTLAQYEGRTVVLAWFLKAFTGG